MPYRIWDIPAVRQTEIRNYKKTEAGIGRCSRCRPLLFILMIQFTVRKNTAIQSEGEGKNLIFLGSAQIALMLL